MDIFIRQADLTDVPAMARIERESFDSPWSANEITKDVMAGGGVYVAVALLGEERVGYAEVRSVAGEAQIYNIAIAPEMRGRGVGEALLRHVISAAEAQGCNVVTLEVKAGNDAAMKLYEKLGFREVGRRPRYYKGVDAVLMDLEMEQPKEEEEVRIEVEVL